MEATEFRGIADASQPNAGRMYDYFLGGNHNFEIDREAAKQVVEIAPFLPKLLKLIRWFLGEAIRKMVDEGYTHFIDFASGLPTIDHIHQVAPEGTKVIYSDIDPVTVAYAQEIIGDNDHVKYVQCDAAKPEVLLNSGIVEETFGDIRRVAIGFNGISWFLTSEQVNHAMSVLYDWAAPDSKLFISEGDNPDTPEKAEKLRRFYEEVGQPIFYKPLNEFAELIKPWKIAEPGMKKLEEWLEMSTDVSETIEQEWQGAGAIYGGFLRQ